MMSIRVRLIVAMVLIGILPTAIAVFGTSWMMRDLAVVSSQGALEEIGKMAIYDQALTTAQQVASYLDTHPEVDLDDVATLRANRELATLAVQPVGKTGYTAIFDANAITHFHSSPSTVGMDMSTLADRLPAFWAIMSASLDGSEVDGFYDWEDADGVIRPKYMAIVPVGDTMLRVAATTYMDEFSQPAEIISAELGRVAALTGRRFAVLVAVAFVASLLAGVVLSNRLTLPLREMASAAARVVNGEWGAVRPLQRRDEVGVLSRALSTMTSRMQVLIEGLEQHVAERTATLSAAADVSQATTTVLDPDELVRQVVRVVRDRFDLYYVGLFMLDEQGQHAVLRAGTGEAGQEMLARGHQLQVGGASMIGQCVARSEARVALDVGQEAVRFDNPLLPETRSELALPMRARGKVIGAMTVQSAEGAAFDEAYIAVLQTMADQVAVAIDNARLFQQVEASLQAERRAYGEIAREAWQELFRARPNLAFASDARGTVTFADWEPQMKAAVRTGLMIGAESGTDPNVLALPIKIRDQVVGVIDGRKPDGTAWTTDEIDLLLALSDQLSAALEGAQLYDATQRRASRERLTREITDRMRAALDWDQLLQVAVQEMADALGASRAFVQWLEPQALGEGAGRADE